MCSYNGDGRDCTSEMPDTTQPPERIRGYCIMGECTCPENYYLYSLENEECRLRSEPDGEFGMILITNNN